MTFIRSLVLVAAGAGAATAGLLVWQARPGAHGDSPAVVETAAAAPDRLALDAGQQTRLGVAIGRLSPTQNEAGIMAFARVLDVGPLAAIDGEILTAQAAAAASAADAARLAELARQDQSASARSVQLAAVQATTDQQRVALAERRVALEFGPGLAVLGAAERASLVADIAARRAALLRIDIPGTANAPGRLAADAPGRVTVGDPPRPVAVLGPAATTDARIQGTSLLAVLRGPGTRDAAAGRLLPARIAGGPVLSGAIVPNAAVVRSKGHLWVYVPKAGSFERRAIDDARPVPDGWFVTYGVGPGDRIVTAGAGALLGIENGPAPARAD